MAKANELITIKISKAIHRQVKTYCASVGETVLDYYNNAAFSGLPKTSQQIFEARKKKKAK